MLCKAKKLVHSDYGIPALPGFPPVYDCPQRFQLPLEKVLQVLGSVLDSKSYFNVSLSCHVDPSQLLASFVFRYEWALLYSLKSSSASSLDRPVLSELCLSG